MLLGRFARALFPQQPKTVPRSHQQAGTFCQYIYFRVDIHPRNKNIFAYAKSPQHRSTHQGAPTPTFPSVTSKQPFSPIKGCTVTPRHGNSCGDPPTSPAHAAHASLCMTQTFLQAYTACLMPTSHNLNCHACKNSHLRHGHTAMPKQCRYSTGETVPACTSLPVTRPQCMAHDSRSSKSAHHLVWCTPLLAV